MDIKQRISIQETLERVGQEAILGGWIFRKRDHGKLSFIDLRDSNGILQIVVTPATEIINPTEESFGLESVLLVRGLIKERPAHMINLDSETGKLEMEVSQMEIISPTTEALPLDISKEIEKVHLDTLLNHRALTLRNPKMQAIFRLSEKILAGYREFLTEKKFVEIHTPKIIPSATEGGANVFRVDYFGRDVFLAQSPQFYKQMMVGVFEKVFEVGPVFRAEPHYTSRHINEITMLDAELGFIESEETVMELLEECVRFICAKIKKEANAEKQILNFTEPLLPKKEIPRLTLKEVAKIISKRRKVKKEDFGEETLDLDAEGEKILGKYIQEKYGSDFVFVTEYPVVSRPFYQMPDPENPRVTKSFDLIFRGLELGTGSQRIHNPKELVASLKKHGLKPEDFDEYLDLFRYGMPPHGGWGLGLERFVKQWLELDNVRLASLFPRDVKRVSP